MPVVQHLSGPVFQRLDLSRKHDCVPVSVPRADEVELTSFPGAGARGQAGGSGPRVDGSRDGARCLGRVPCVDTQG